MTDPRSFPNSLTSGYHPTGLGYEQLGQHERLANHPSCAEMAFVKHDALEVEVE
jgi:hypothetical protein